MCDVSILPYDDDYIQSELYDVEYNCFSLVWRKNIVFLYTINHSSILILFQEMTGLECQHLFCVSCWDRYLKVMVMDEGKGEVNIMLTDKALSMPFTPTYGLHDCALNSGYFYYFKLC